MKNLRRKQEANPLEPVYVRTVEKGVGYKFNEGV